MSSPTLVPIWLADTVERDEAAGRLNVSGIFDRLEVPAGSLYADGAVVFFGVTNVHKPTELRLVYVDLEDDLPILERRVKVEGSPLETTDISVRVNQIPVPHSGFYVWEVYDGMDRLGALRIEAVVKGAES